MKKYLLIILAFLIWDGLSSKVLSGEKYWVFFNDKGDHAKNLSKIASRSLSARAVQRRLLRVHTEPVFDETDLPVYSDYINKLKNLGVNVLHKSRWLNAVSVAADPVQIAQIKLLPMVKKVSPVLTLVRRPVDQAGETLKKRQGAYDNFYDYGASIDQIEQLNVQELHNRGFSGNGVLITLIDSGFYYQLHQAFTNLDIIAERDFINHDNVTRNEDGQDTAGQHSHGTRVLSVVGGFLPGQLIGPAFGATYALAKTEYIPTETRIEEDNWVAAIEWADSLGTDVVSTSLGYRDFDDGFAYKYEDLDGETMVTSIAATAAVKKGIVVVASAGNEGDNFDWPYITSPADGMGVIAVGAVNSFGDRVYFSSIGPTSDGRIKPDLMAMGSLDAMVSPDTETKLSFGSGTSFAAPLMAGVCALLLEVKPDLTPAQLAEALKSTASQSMMPDNYMGWGIVDAFAAANTLFVGGVPDLMPHVLKLYPSSINPIAGYTKFMIDSPVKDHLKISIFNAVGRHIESLDYDLFAGKGNVFLWRWPANLSSGIYFARFELKNEIKAQKFLIYR